MTDITNAIKALRPNSSFGVVGDRIKWNDPDNSQPTEQEINDKIVELKADYDSKQYQRDRQYPDLGEQFDLLFKDINEGTLDKTGGFYTAIKSVKDAHPKPSE